MANLLKERISFDFSELLRRKKTESKSKILKINLGLLLKMIRLSYETEMSFGNH